jgi:hypothetical protein
MVHGSKIFIAAMSLQQKQKKKNADSEYEILI